MKDLIITGLCVALIAAFAIGWVLNLVAIFHGMAGPMTVLMVIRIIGIFVAPIGAVVGYV